MQTVARCCFPGRVATLLTGRFRASVVSHIRNNKPRLYHNHLSTMSTMASARTALHEVSDKGEFKRTDAGFRNVIQAGGEFPPQVLQLKGLSDIIDVVVVHPTWQRTRPDVPGDEHAGWALVDPEGPPLSSPTGHGSFSNEGCTVDKYNNARFIRDLYEKANDTTGKYSVPVLWDLEKSTIVSNESAEIIRMFNDAFNEFATNAELDLYPEALRPAIDAVNEWIYPTINNGVYRCGFATSQEAYEKAFKELFASLDRCESILETQEYIAGNQLTEADIRLFMTLIRFDEVYVVYFKTNKKFIHEYPRLKAYVQRLYRIPEVGSAINMRHIKVHYFTSHPRLNYYAIVPIGGDAWWE